MKTKDFLTNHTFIKWVNHPDKELDTYWKNWMDANPEHLPQLKLARELLLKIEYKDFAPRTGAKQRILDNILNSPKPAPSPSFSQAIKYIKPKGNIWDKAGQFTRIAAILLVIFSLSWLAFPNKDTDSTEILAEKIYNIQKGTASGEKLQIILPDGTRVWLNSVSELEFPENFNSVERVVKLTGEGFFEVQKDSLRPFKVVANGTVTTALGTSFNINTKYNEGVKISLLTGKVKVKVTSASENVFLEPGQELRYVKQTEKISISGFNARETGSWKDGLIIFSEASLMEVVNQLEDWYGVKINLQNAEGVDWEYSGEYSHQSLDNVLNSLSYIQKFKYTIHDKNVEFKF